MEPKRTTRSTPATTTTTTTTSVTNAQLKALINQGIANALAARDADRSRNGEDSHDSRMGARRQAPPTRYNQHFQELALLCVRMFPEESNKVERYVSGLLDMIHGSVVASRLKTMQEAIEMASELMDKRNNTFAERQAEKNQKFDDTSKNYKNQQQPTKGKNVARAYTARSGEKKPYGGSKPLCPKCNYHHNGPCAPKCYKCNRVGHLVRDCKSPANAINNQNGTGTRQKPTCYECGNQGHYMSDCPELKNQNHRNQAEVEVGATTTMTIKLSILNPGEYDLWLMRIEQYFLMTDYSFWEVIKNGNKVLTKAVGSSEQTYEPTTSKEKQDRRNDIKARGTLLKALPNKDQLKFHSYQDAKLLMEAIKERLQKLISQLELQGEVIQQEDMNLKLLRSLPSEWKNHALIWRNKEMAMLTIRARRAPQNQDNRGRENRRTTVPMETPTKNALIAQDGIGGYDWSYQAEEETPINYAFMAPTSSGSSSSSDSKCYL
uniref:CCHC-type domain-containing protein n=1 Tax=Tanacetum cinerariifolium TaxID=118510 RepID=A0A699HLS5_TANCI|nr:hypothetical protein [Tanacetum cinerariifolium]